MAIRRHIHIVTSDQPRNGKTLFARALADWLWQQGGEPWIADGNGPLGDISRWYGGHSRVFDLERTAGRVDLFEFLLTFPTTNIVLDLPASQMESFFSIFENGHFPAEAARAHTAFTCWFIIDRPLESFLKARQIWHVAQAEFRPVLNSFSGSYALERGVKLNYAEMAARGELRLPVLSPEAREWLAGRGHSFRHLFVESQGRFRPPTAAFTFQRLVNAQLEGMFAAESAA